MTNCSGANRLAKKQSGRLRMESARKHLGRISRLYDWGPIPTSQSRQRAMAEGYIYILLKRAFQNDHYKIGMTTKTPEDRAREISNATGVPRAFEVLYEQRVIDCQRAERVLHQRLHQYRSGSNREFFQLPLKTAI